MTENKKHKWTREDDILALDAYFQSGVQNGDESAVARARDAIHSEPESFTMKLSQIRSLNRFESENELAAIPAQLREVWAEYCRDKSWMLWRLQQTPPPDFAEACRDISRLRRDAQTIIRRRKTPQKIPRREVRRTAMHILYAAQTQNISAADSLLLMQKSAASAREKSALKDELLLAVVAMADGKKEEIERRILDAAKRTPEQISAVEFAVLRVAVAELLSHPRAESATIIDEAVEIAKQFGAEGGYKIVNGALHTIAAQTPKSDA